MRLVFGLVLIVGVALAGFAAYMAKNRFDQYQAKVAAQEKLLKSNVPLEAVFTVKRQIAYGETLTKDDVQIIAWPNNAIPEGAFQKGEDLFPATGALRTVLRVMEKDEAVMASKVTEPGEDAGVSSRLSKGMRAFALRVDVSSGVSGFLRPGDHVDVYWTGNSQGREVTKLIDTRLQLLAVDQIADGDRSAPTIARTVTVAASPAEVGALAQAQSSGRLSLSLVGAGDDTEVAAVEIDQNQLLGILEEKAIEAKAAKVCTIKTRKGAEVVEIPIPCAE
ncbi:pilus assembly protein CpaB [Litoreibacter ascidiaceicola]|uniref:Pilus assembly protein CpaB n=1 Tax=Litoreibacter ascidiaceicola TaxID=1486859 RepID=A0A1M4Y9H2_9RHOB|nr:Flp pilus assembly protein CpaB [Litoreibacter ascidiaceicola]SHF02152.1 pilus assembly protein CpaB [Litoreibacter ascidiaceicola]